MDLNGKAIKVNNKKHAQEVYAFFRAHGFKMNEAEEWQDSDYCRMFPYLCGDDGHVTPHSINYVMNNRFEIIQLPVDMNDGLSVYKEKLMYVSNYPITEENMKDSLKRLVFMKHDGLYYTWSDTIVSLNNEIVRVHPRMIQTWKYAMDVPTEDKNKQELIKKVDELIKLSDELIKEGTQLKAKAVAMKAAANKL